MNLEANVSAMNIFYVQEVVKWARDIVTIYLYFVILVFLAVNFFQFLLFCIFR